MVLRRFRPLLLCSVALVGLWTLAVCARTESVRVTSLRGFGVEDIYTVTCRIANPSDNDAHLVAVISVLANKVTTKGDLYVSLAETERELVIPANGEFPLRVDFARNWGWLRIVHPHVTVRPASNGQ